MKQLTPNVFTETGKRGCNHSFVVTREGIVCIDTPFRPTDAVAWREELKKHGDIRFLIQTEPHVDHVTGNGFLGGAVVAQEETRQVMRRMTLKEILERVVAIDTDAQMLMQGYQLRLPSITFAGRMTLHVGDHTFQLTNLPGHTIGQTAVYVPEEKVVFTGDNVSYKVQPFMVEAVPEEWVTSIERLQQLDAKTVVPGHGEVCDKAYLREWESFLRECLVTVQGAIERGWTREQAVEKISFLHRYPMAPGNEARGPEVSRLNVGRIWDALTAKKA